MQARFVVIGLFIIVLLVAAGCAPNSSGTTALPAVGSAAPGDTRGAHEPTVTPTPPVSPLPTPTPTDPVSPLAAPKGVSSSTEYTVARGDTLAKIAASFDVTVDEILVANPKIKNVDLIYVGQKLIIPAKD